MIAQGILVPGTSLGAVVGPLGACLLLAVVAAFAFLIEAILREPAGRRIVRGAAPAPRTDLSTDADRRRPAA